MNKILRAAVAAAAIGLAAMAPAQASLYTSTYGTQLAGPSNCDDCYAGPIAFTGTDQSVNFFGTTYSAVYVGSNGYITFGAGNSSFSTQALDVQTVAPMIAAFYTDLDSRADDASNVYVNTDTAGEIVVTWENMGHFSGDYSVRSTFQILLRSDQLATQAGLSQIGIFYGDVTDTRQVSAGFGDGLAPSDPGEVAFASFVNGNTLSNSAPRLFNLNAGGVPVDVPEPASLALLAMGGAALAGMRRRRKQ
jgi:hypothetical protein